MACSIDIKKEINIKLDNAITDVGSKNMADRSFVLSKIKEINNSIYPQIVKIGDPLKSNKDYYTINKNPEVIDKMTMEEFDKQEYYEEKDLKDMIENNKDVIIQQEIKFSEFKSLEQLSLDFPEISEKDLTDYFNTCK